MTSLSKQAVEEYEVRIALVEDQRKIVSLLSEYSDKLNSKCDTLSKKKCARLLYTFTALKSEKTVASFLIILWKGIALGIVALGLFVTYTKTIIPVLQSFGLDEKAFRNWLIFLAFFPLLLLILLIRNSNDKIELMEKNAKSLVYRLEKLVDFASEFHEYIEVNSVNKIELDLRLNDAESALRYYNILVKEKKKLLPKLHDI